jgi:hypothetical protein
MFIISRNRFSMSCKLCRSYVVVFAEPFFALAFSAVGLWLGS